MPITLPASLTDELDAVNVLLQAIAEAPVNSIEISESVDVAAARQTLNEVMLAVQSEGWHWNTEYQIELTPNVSNQIDLPETALFITGQPKRIGERARKLYDREEHTFTFTEPQTVNLVVRLDWTEMPEYARRYITIRAAKQFQGRLQTNASVDRITDAEVVQAKTVLETREHEADPKNAITGNAQVAGRIHGRARRRF